MDSSPEIGFLEVDRLLESSRPQPRMPLIWVVAGTFFMLLLVTAMARGQSAESRRAVAIVSAVAMAALVGGISLVSLHTVRALRREQSHVEQIGELVQLRRWPDAGLALESYLSQPARTPLLRVQALVFLAPVLARLKRFDDAITVQNYLIDEELVDAGTAAALKVGRAMAMLGEDHLFDVDRAISELRRGPAAGSAALALVEIYRDVKTGHPNEAIETYERMLPTLREQLGQRVADAYGLAARAYDLLGREADATTAYRNATLLAPPRELVRRYPELEKLTGRYQPAPAPPEAA